jgi:glycosyltransferase involved in cell wall biosynthesis
MAMKLPCVTSSLAGKPLEGAQHNEHLLICDSVEEYVEAVAKLLNEKRFFNTIAKTAYQFVKTNYDWIEVGKLLESVMNEDFYD